MDELQRAINDSTIYREAGRTWQWPLALILDAGPALGYSVDAAVVLELGDGRCVRADLMSSASVDVPFIIRGSYAVWKRVVQGTLDPIAAIVQGKLRLKGNLGTVIRHVTEAQALVQCAQAVPTAFADDVP